MELVLASTSVFRRSQLRSLGYSFRCVAPDVSEAIQVGESPPLRAARLAWLKALSASEAAPSAAVVGGDQVACCEGTILQKPLTAERAVAQLLSTSGKEVEFFSAVCIASPRADPLEAMDRTVVTFRNLMRAEVERYVVLDRPMQCAGAFKSESLGLHLLAQIETRDPSALVGLPLMAVSKALRSLDINPLMDG